MSEEPEILPPRPGSSVAVQRRGPGFPPNAGKGRPKGAVNKTTRDLREMIVQALDNMGGVNYLMMIAAMKPEAFIGLVGRTLPLKVAGDPDNPLVVQHVFVKRTSVKK